MDKISLTESLIQQGILKKIETPNYFYLSLFGKQHFAKSDVILFDEVFEDYRKIAKFVAPNVVSTVNQNRTFDVKSFRPAYAKEKDVIEAWSETLQHRTAGEAIAGSKSPAERAKAMRAKQLRMHRIMMKNLHEYMCSQALLGAQVTISGQDYPITTVSYYRNSNLTATTLGTAQSWATATNNPLESLAMMADRVYTASNAEVDTLIMGRTAWQNFYKYMTHKDNRHLIDKEIRGSDLQTNLITLGSVRNVQRVMSFTGLNGTKYEVWLDNRVFRNHIGTTRRYIADNEVFGMSSSEFQGVMAFGAIKDADAGWQPMEMYHKEFRTNEPSADYLLTQSAPLPINLNPNSTFRILNANA